MVNMLSFATTSLATAVSFPHEPAELLFRLRRALPGFTYSSHLKFSHNNQAHLPLMATSFRLSLGSFVRHSVQYRRRPFGLVFLVYSRAAVVPMGAYFLCRFS